MKVLTKVQSLILVSLMLLFSFAPVNAQEEEDDNYLNVGGAVRFNMLRTSYEGPSTSTSTNATLDTWRLNVGAKHSGVTLDFEYRFYPTFNTHFLKHGYLGYDFSEDLNMQLGVTQVPFGNLTYNSHSWWFLTPYYIGLEDDHNMGIKFDYDASDRLNIMAAYFRQAEPAGPAYGNASFGGPGAGTYSYNVIPDGDLNASIQEHHQFNLRLNYELFDGTFVGFSGQRQGILNTALDDTEYGNTWALHLDSDFDNFNLKLQYTSYDYKAKDDAGNTLDRVQMGAYGDPYYGDGVAASGDLITAGLAYTIGVDWGPISSVQPYIDYSYYSKDGSIELEGVSYDFEDSHMLVPGFLVSAGNIFTYVDWAFGKNHAWLTDDFGTGFGIGHTDDDGVPIPTEDLSWNMRFNINVGYYF
ncbi:hypothetical protein QA597_08580 [Marinilabiliaceae bacterium ANBcel2]|nr:hypothetical protein [Marinilabiliaceae bacterium ANBcel2]